MIDPKLADAARRAPYLGAEEERDLIVCAQRGDARARERLVLSHLRLVIREARKRKGYRVPLDDLVQEGSVGLVDAIDRFDLAQPVRFGTYAAFWIRAAMTEAMLRGHSIVRRNTSSAGKSMFFNLRRARAELERSGKLSAGEVVDRLVDLFGVDPETIRSMLVHLEGGDTSLHVQVGAADGDSEFGDLIPDEGALPDEIASDAIDAVRVREQLHAAIATLNDRERAIILARRYVEGEDEETLCDLGVRFKISCERVRQIELRALDKMRAFLTGAPIVRKRGPARGAGATRQIVAQQAPRGVGARVYQIESDLRRERSALAA